MKTLRSLTRIVIGGGPGLWLPWLALLGLIVVIAFLGGPR